MIHKLNLIRYCIAIVLPFVLLCHYDVKIVLASLVLLLLVNNIVDDLIFYYGGAFINSNDVKGSILSPIEGTVTLVEKDVPFKRYVHKKDVINGATYLRKVIQTIADGKKYTHVAVFLNKFNKHIVCNIGSEIIAVRTYNVEGALVDMVVGKELIAKASGNHCFNTFYEIEYENGCKALVTMDRYVSKFKFLNDKECLIDGIIYRGSQCDLYIPIEYDVNISEGDAIKCFQPIVEGEEVNFIDGTSIRETVTREVGINVCNGEIIVSNICKTLSTNVIDKSFKFFVALASFIISSTLFGYVLVFFLLSFYLRRCFKNLLYAICNEFGYKEWQTKANTIINDALI